MPHFETVAQVVTQAATELGLGLSAADQADPFDSSDPNVPQMLALLTSAGREIVRDYGWSQSLKEGEIVTVDGTDNYALPDDFLRMVPSTGWNRTNSLPVGGPVGSEEWQYLVSGLVGVSFNVTIRKWKGAWYIFPNGADAPGGHTIVYEYMSSYWVAPGNIQPIEAAGDAVTASDDILLFDTHLMSRALKRAWKRAKGFASQVEEDDYQKALDQEMDNDSTPRVLSLTGSRPAAALLGQQNIPESGFGS